MRIKWRAMRVPGKSPSFEKFEPALSATRYSQFFYWPGLFSPHSCFHKHHPLPLPPADWPSGSTLRSALFPRNFYRGYAGNLA